MAAADPAWNDMLQLMEDVLSAPVQTDRSPEIIQKILPVFRTRTPLLYDLSKDILVDIAKNASLKKFKRDHAVVWQGQEGKKFGIILKGAASVHARKEQSGLPQQDSVPIPHGIKDRTALVGPQLGTLATGSSFGEMIMASHDHCTYNSTIVAEELTHVLLIDKELYARSFGAHQEAWQNKMQFVDQSPFFQNLTPAIKNLLMDNLKPLEIQFGNRFVKQGSVCNSLFFVCHGWGKVLADVRMSMSQFELMKANPETKDKQSGRRTSFLLREHTYTSGVTLDPSRPLSVIEKRRYRHKCGYVAIETLLRHKESQVTTTGPNDVIGDIEIITNLPSYCASVECMESLKVYELSKYNFQQIIAQRCPATYNVINNGVQCKLHFRSQRLPEIPLYTLLYERALSSPKDTKKGSVAASLFWKEKASEVRNIKKVTGMMKQMQSTKLKASAETNSNEAESGNASKIDEKQLEKKGPKQYTVDEFRSLKKKMQAQGKVLLASM